ncbi:MAG TPA: ABC transporter substrate-binding protein [Pseudonocardiaceae bacterium]|nr:ABC transporter substrate-binding protein [Pseudonocardiaceae bacterium]
MCALVLAASCSALSGNSSDSSSSGGSNSQSLEKPTIKVGAIAGSSSAPLYIASDKGYFKQEGLNVQVVTTTNGGQALQQLQGGALDITLANDVSGIKAAIKGAPLKLVFDGPSTAPHTFVVSALPDSGITKLADLQGKKVGVSSLNDAIMATIKQELVAVNVDPTKVQFVTVPYAQSETALKSKSVNAAVTSEPYATEAAEALGARPVVDVFPQGSAESNIPNAGYFSTSKFVQNDPKTLAAFQKAMAKAAADTTNRKNVEAAIHKHLPTLPQQVLDVMAMPGFPPDLDPARIQRVADLMQQASFIKSHYDVRQILAPFAGSSS